MQHDTVDTFDGHPTTTGYDDAALPTTRVTSLSRPAHDADETHDAHDTHDAPADDWIERDRSEAALCERERLFRTTFDRAPIGIAHVAHDGRWLRCNPRLCDLLGYSREELARLSIQDLSHPDDLDAELDCIRRALAGELDEYELEKRHVRKDGALVWTHLTVSLVRTAEGEPEYFIVMLQDITERRRLEEDRARLLEWEQATRAAELAAREASRRMEEFLATASHDLRSPLTVTLGYIALAERQTKRLAATAESENPDFLRQVADVRRQLEDADQGAHRLSRLLTRLFDTAAIRAGKLELHRAPCDLAALVREQVAAQRVAAPERSVTLHTPPGGEPIPVEADADRIGQVITNYLTNALKYSPPDRPVDVFVEARGSRARVAVRDQGPGIPKEERGRIWELFHRAPAVAAKAELPGGIQGGSLGLGLHICKASITAHGGRVGVKSAVGEGSTFWFTLPLSGPRSGLASAAP
ncbi:MAG: sensor histidine kinase [Ktedonobacterales bacterium]